MTEAVEGGAALAWRLLATLEGGSLLLATSALLAYTARAKVAGRKRRTVKNVLITNTTSTLGREITRRLVARGCTVSIVEDVATSGGDSPKIDALVVVGAEIKQDGLVGLTQIVTEDVYNNVKLLEHLSALVHQGGCMAWACSGAMTGSFCGACSAYDDVLRASLQHIARSRQCEPVWIDRCGDPELAAERTVASLLPCANQQPITAFSMRNVAQKLSDYFGRWLKTVT